ncbi:MAG TPA: hypothetical protein VFM18_07845 [Methanosarcina sp.]|nr:hypothetical protein [Methanosarcina sp.]
MSAKTADTLDNGATAQGEALANVFIDTVQNQGNSLMRFVKDLFDLSLDGRKAFRVKIEHMLKEQRAYVREQDGTPQHEQLKKALASASVRLSEAVTISKAFDAGFNPVWEQDSTGKWLCRHADQYHNYHSVVSLARLFLDTSASNGPTVKRGRKATPLLEKAVNYISKLGLTEEEMEKLAELLQASAESDHDTN